MNIRKLTESDYETLASWWKAWKWPPVQKDFLPDNGTGGFVIEKEGIMIVAGFVYITNSKAVLLEWIISNPEYREDDRDMAITCLIKTIEKIVKDWGYKYIFSIGRTKTLIDKHKELGYHVDDTPSYEITKILN
tara:strand:- start:11807 stop:12208 length:402 start_codon:yes stop_codon:yes gene_type:complete